MKRLIYPILILIFASMACSLGPLGAAATPTPVPPTAKPLFEVPTEVPKIQPAPTDTENVPQTANEAPQVANPTEEPTGGSASPSDYFTENFQESVNNWGQWVTAGDPNKEYVQLMLGRLHFELPSTETYVYVNNVNYSYKDVLAVTSFETIDIDGKNGIALLCRISDAGWYEVRVSTMGDHAGWMELYRYDPRLKDMGKNPYTNLLMPTYKQDSLPIQTILNGYQTNTIGLQCKGNTISVYANGKAMTHPRTKETIEVTDDALTEGGVGVGVMSFSGGKVYVEFDNFSTNPPQ